MKQYNAKYDAYYDDEQNVWLESTCGNERCEYCGARPATPSEVICKSCDGPMPKAIQQSM